MRGRKKVLHLTDIIVNENLGTGTISHIVSSRNLSASFTSAATHLITTAANLKIVIPDQNDKGGGIHRGLYGKTLVTMGGTPDILRR